MLWKVLIGKKYLPNTETMKKALLIGINYKNTPYELYGCVNDVNLIAQILIQKYGYHPANVRLLTDDGMAPTKANIQSHIQWLVSGIRNGDTLFFYYSGHGAYTRDTSGDESDGHDEMIIPLDVETNGIITDDWLHTNMVRRVPKGVTLWGFSDCCYSGTMFDLRYCVNYVPEPVTNGKTYTIYNPNDWKNKYMLSNEGTRDIQGTVCFFSGALDSEVATDAFFGTSAQGAFTVALVLALQSKSSKRVKDVLKQINCHLTIMGFPTQHCELSAGRSKDLDIVCSF